MSEKGNTKIVPMFMGTRADHAPQPLTTPVFAWDCAKCHAKTYSIAKPPLDATCICNVCVAQITAQAQQDPATQVAWSMTAELEDGVKDIAKDKGLPTEQVFNRFLEWKLGRPTHVSLYNQPKKEKEKE